MVPGNIVTTNTETNTSSSTDRPGIRKRFFMGWYGPSLLSVLLLATFLAFWQLGQNGYSNLYYAAGTRSMLSNWHNFFYVSFDPNGFVSIDKPPLDFWIQVLSAKIFGFTPLSILFPQALAGVASIALLAHLVRRVFGSLAALLAALALTLTPISVLTSRNNDVDSMLVLFVLVAAWAVCIAAEKGSLRWLLLGMGIVGLGFNIKMAEAYLVVPAFVLLYLLTAQRRWIVRIGHLALALIVMLAISLSWAVAVDLTPPAQRPYVGSSGNNSALNLTFGYNGLNRLLGHRPPPPPAKSKTTAAAQPTQAGETGYPGLRRLFNDQLAGQISWFIPLALIGIIVLLWRKRPRILKDSEFRGLLLWGIWFLAAAAFFSYTGSFHVYYMVMFAPAICALMGIGIATLWHEYIRTTIRGWFLPVSLLITALIQLKFLMAFPEWNSWLVPTIAGVVSIAVVALFALWLIGYMIRQVPRFIIAALTAAGLSVLLLAPAIWSIIPVEQNRNSGFPIAGPYSYTGPEQKNTQNSTQTQTTVMLSPTDPELIRYLEAHQGTASYILALPSSNFAAAIIVQTGKAVMAIGGYAGGDHILTRAELIKLVRQGVVRYFLLSGNTPSSRATTRKQEQERAQRLAHLSPNGGTTSWVPSVCQSIAPSVWRPDLQGVAARINNGLVLYDCADVSAH